MAFRWGSGLLIVICAGLAGVECRRRLKARASSLVCIQHYLRQVASYISHYGMGLDEIAVELARANPSDPLSQKTRDYIKQTSFWNAFSIALNELKTCLCLTDADLALMTLLINGLKGFDVDGALSSLAFADQRLAEEADAANKKAETDGKLYVTLGFCLGVAAALIIV